MVNLETTNWLLGAIAVASVVQTVMLLVLGIAGFRFYRQATAALEELESRHVAPLRRQVDGVLTQVNSVLSEAQSIAARVNHQTERVDGALHECGHSAPVRHRGVVGHRLCPEGL